MRWLAVLLLALPLLALAQEQALITNVGNRLTHSLNGRWHAIVDPYEAGYYDYRRQPYDQQPAPHNGAFYRHHRPQTPQELVEYDFDRSPTLRVPGDWNSQRRELLYYEGTVWLKRSFDFSPRRPGSRVFVHFGAVNQRATVYLNGHRLGEHEGGFTPFNFEVGHLLKARGNFLVVKADNTRRADAVPTTSTDWWNYGGITREVHLIEEPPVFVRDHVLQLQPGSTHRLAGALQLDGAQGGELLRIRIPELGLEHVLAVDAQGSARYAIEAPTMQRWSPRQPKLYEVQVWRDGAAQPLWRDHIGFRSIEVKGSDILLNGQALFLRGISVHDEIHGRRAHSLADARHVLAWARRLGANFLRLAHYPHHEALVRLADREGVLLWKEIPVYWTVDFTKPSVLAQARQQLQDMVLRDRNRAAVVIWSVANETPVSAPRNAFVSALVDRARELDPTRLVSAALETHAEGDLTVVDDPIGERLDIVAFNQYRGWYGGSLADAPQARWAVRSDKPVVVSEFGGDAKAGLHGARSARWTEEYQAYLYQQNLAMLNNIPSLRGISPWILFDFRSPRRTLPGIQDGYNRKGLVSDRGQPKLAFEVLRRHYRQRQVTTPP